MTEIKDSELQALVTLLDDSDPEVLEHVSEKLSSFGPEIIPKLEAAWESTAVPLVQERLEELISQIHFNYLQEDIVNWLEDGAEDLLQGALLINRFLYPDLDESKVIVQLEKLYNNVWLEFGRHLTPMEEVQVVNHILYTLHSFTGNAKLSFDPDLGYISQVLQNKRGNSITLGIIYLVIAQRLNMPVYGVNLPYHFVIAYCNGFLSDEQLEENSASGEVLFYVNPLNKGAIFSRSEIAQYLEKSQIKSQVYYYAPCNNKSIVQSLIMNQLACYDHGGDQDKARQLKKLYELFSTEDIEPETEG